MTTATHRDAAKPARVVPKTGYEKWEDGVKDADASWDTYDCDIQSAVNEFNRHLSGTAGYLPLDWQIVKAMAWVETGARSPWWASNPMQIGMYSDPGLDALLGAKEGGELILPAQMKLTASVVRASPSQNIRAGIGYMLMRMATFGFQTFLDADTTIREVTVKPGDNGFERIAKEVGSTTAIMKALNPTVRVLHVGQALKYQKASVRKVVVRWAAVTPASIGMLYNAKQPELYAKKMSFALGLIRQRNAAACK